MHVTALAAAIDAAWLHDLDTVAKGVWAALGADLIDDTEAEALSARIEARRARRTMGGQVARRLGMVPALPSSLPAVTPATPARSLFSRARQQVVPNRAASRARRRLLAASGPMPPRLASSFTTAELAVLRLVADEVAARAVCGLTFAELAARAGVSRSTVKRALRLARRLGLVTLEERPRPGRKHLASLVRIVSAEWRAWIGHRLFREGRQVRPIGGQMRPTTGKGIFSRAGRLPSSARSSPSNTQIGVPAVTG